MISLKGNDNAAVGFIVVHLGAGYHSISKLDGYKALARRACQLGAKLCKEGHYSSHIACEVVSLLEDSRLTNAGFGSNLTRDGSIQCDAGLMDSQSKSFAATGCLEGIRNPIRVAYALLQYQGEDNAGLVPPILMVGDGAKQWAIERGFPTVNSDQMISDCSLRTFRESLRKLQKHQDIERASKQASKSDEVLETPDRFENPRFDFHSKTEQCNSSNPNLPGELTDDESSSFRRCCENMSFDSLNQVTEQCHHRESLQSERSSGDPYCGKAKKRKKECVSSNIVKSQLKEGRLGSRGIFADTKMDTVGAICVDKYGNVCAAVSSGGLILKHSGRVGQAACYGSGCFVSDEASGVNHMTCASSTSGCGEQLIKTLLAKHCVDTMMCDKNYSASDEAGTGCKFNQSHGTVRDDKRKGVKEHGSLGCCQGDRCVCDVKNNVMNCRSKLKKYEGKGQCSGIDSVYNNEENCEIPERYKMDEFTHGTGDGVTSSHMELMHSDKDKICLIGSPSENHETLECDGAEQCIKGCTGLHSNHFCRCRKQNPSCHCHIHSKHEITDEEFSDSIPDENSLHSLLEKGFLESSYLKNEEAKLAGCINVKLIKCSAPKSVNMQDFSDDCLTDTSDQSFHDVASGRVGCYFSLTQGLSYSLGTTSLGARTFLVMPVDCCVHLVLHPS